MGRDEGHDFVCSWPDDPCSCPVEHQRKLEEIARTLAFGGVKNDAEKTRLDLIAPEFLEALGQILTLGAKKYAAYNWAKGMAWSRPYAALLRHLFAWWGGETLDKESGKSHLWHATCELMFLVAYEARHSGEDDRWVTNTATNGKQGF